MLIGIVDKDARMLNVLFLFYIHLRFVDLPRVKRKSENHNETNSREDK